MRRKRIFQGKIALVTGSGKGIGKAVALELASKGVTVILNGRNREKLDSTLAEFTKKGFRANAIPGDISDPEQIRTIINRAASLYGQLDIAVLNAGVSGYGLVEETSAEQVQQVMHINTLGSFYCTRELIPHLRRTRGSVVFISSLAGLHGIPRSSVYCMSKMALTALAQSLRLELKGTGVHIGLIHVGFTVNEADKTVCAPDGTTIPIQHRPSWLQQSREKVAREVVRTIRRRRFRVVLSPLGKLFAFFRRYFPGFTLRAMQFTNKSSEKLTRK